jgi:uncharacterized protein UPF0158
MRPRTKSTEPDLETLLREAFTAEDPEAAWYLDLGEPRVVRVSHGTTSIPDLSAEEVEEHGERYVEVPAVTESELHLWIEDFVEERADPKVAALLDEKHGANARFLAKLAKADAAAFDAWKRFHGARVDAAIAAWRAESG